MLSKLSSILTGWKNYAWESEEVREMAEARAKECGKCDSAVSGPVPTFIVDKIKDIEGLVCNECDCPLSALLRSPKEKCKQKKW